MPSPAPLPAVPEGVPHSERGVWAPISPGWRPLFGGFFSRGLSIEWHDFHLDRDLDWARSFHPGSVEVCLNFSGAADLQTGGGQHDLATGQLAIYGVEGAALRATRKAGSLHRFLTIEFSRDFLRERCGADADLFKPAWRAFSQGNMRGSSLLEVAAMTTPLLAMRQGFLEPPVPTLARDTWYLAKAMEVLAHVAFRADETNPLFCHRHQRQNRERVERAQYILERDLENPPSLEMLAGEIGCSPFYLSRIFAEYTGMSIPKFLRTKRIEAAAALLTAGRMNVTEVAMAVGYSSLSAFNRAFVEQMGCCPGLYPAAPIVGRKPTKASKQPTSPAFSGQ